MARDFVGRFTRTVRRYEEFIDVDENAIAQLVKPKNKLRVFEPNVTVRETRVKA